jgi:hypothetical protein
MRDPENLIWLPNALVTGAAKEVPPLQRLRQAGESDTLQLLIELYGEQELLGDGGIPRNLVRQKYERHRICGWGPFEVFGFKAEQSYANGNGPLARYWAMKPNPVWDRFNSLTRMGLIEIVPYLVENETPEAELIHALGGDEYGSAAAEAGRDLGSELPGAFNYEAAEHEYIAPIPKHMQNATVTGIYRLRYRPKTGRTSAWFARHIADCQKATETYRTLASGQFQNAA